MRAAMVVVVLMATTLHTGGALKCLQCDGKNNACKGANMTVVDCGGTCYRKVDITREFDVRRCHPFVMPERRLGMNNEMEDDCYCNMNECNNEDCQYTGLVTSIFASGCGGLASSASALGFVLLLLLLQ